MSSITHECNLPGHLKCRMSIDPETGLFSVCWHGHPPDKLDKQQLLAYMLARDSLVAAPRELLAARDLVTIPLQRARWL